MSDESPSSAEYALQPLDKAVPRANAGALPAVPEHPLHLCPHCRYNLTGLTRYRCPECGEEFTLHDAVRTGGDGVTWQAEDLAVERHAWMRFLGGIALLIAGYVAPLAVASNPGGFTAVYAILMMLIAVRFLLLKAQSDFGWSTFVLITGAAAAVMGLISLSCCLV